MLIKKLLGVALGVSVISGCAIPGSTVDIDNRQPQFSYETPTGAKTTKLNQFLITPELVANLTQISPSSVINPQLDQAIKNYSYKVGVGDVLNVTVWNHPELTIPAGSFRSSAEAGNWVHNDGTIFYPYVGNVKVAGLTVIEIRDLLTKKLTQYIEKPQVDVNISAFRSQRAYITGEVENPGPVEINNVPLTLIQAINAATGLTTDANWHSVQLTRGQHTVNISLRELFERGNLNHNYVLQHNDIVHVPNNDSQKVFVLGDVNSSVTMSTNTASGRTVTIGRSGLTLTEALAKQGGIKEATANAGGIFVFRANNNPDIMADVYQLDANNAIAYVLADQFQLQPRDVVYVTTAPIALWNRVLSQITPTVSAVYQIDRMRAGWQ
ncbi:polysaccharide export protein [Paraferrimonas sp. SM1919]|uniref:polysaccharide export protein n=1 Tax=Paraferrimonas sp. SM1919 TaxID=2662263 RepID=UPI0013D21CC7|nr:polysaccharide export protein [Paraferrimonas sp. SM1919]